MLVSWTSDTVPDIVMNSWRGFLRFMDSGFFLDLSKDFAGRKVKPADFYETALKAYQIEGKQMGMPQGWGTTLFGINTDILGNAGVRLEPNFDETWTQDDLVRMLKQVVKFEPDGKQALPAGADDGTFFHWLWSYGGDFLNADKTQAATTTPEALAAASGTPGCTPATASSCGTASTSGTAWASTWATSRSPGASPTASRTGTASPSRSTSSSGRK